MSVVFSLLLIYVVAGAVIFAGQRSLIYFPTPEVTRASADELRLSSSGESLKIWKISGTGPDAVIYFGGNAEDVSRSISGFSDAFPSHSVYLVNYRGYGGSSGSPSEAALFADAVALHDYISPTHPRISVIGRSLGSGVAVYLASVRTVTRLILVTPYDSILSVASNMLPIFPTSLLLSDKFDSLSYVPRVEAPVLVVVAENDEIIDRKHTDNLVAAFLPEQVEVAIIEHATHNSIDLHPVYAQKLGGFL